MTHSFRIASCMYCKNFDFESGRASCSAFYDIPWPIWQGYVAHVLPYPGDGGVIFDGDLPYDWWLHGGGLEIAASKGGPGSGDKLGHPFRGNQYTSGGVNNLSDAKARLDKIGVYIGKTSDSLLEDPGSLSAAISEIEDLRDEFGVEPKDIVGIVHIARLPEDAYASSQGRHGLLKINGEKTIDWIAESLREDDKINSHGGMLDPRSPFRHEIGHSIESIMERKYPSIAEKWNELWSKEKRNIGKVAKYAKVSQSEAFAELFAIIKYGSDRIRKHPLVSAFKSEVYFPLRSAMSKNIDVTKGGPGSGDKFGHPFRGNQWTKDAKAEIKSINPKFSVNIPKTWDAVATRDLIDELKSVSSEFPHIKSATSLSEIGSSLSVPNATFGMVTIDSSGRSILQMSGAYMEDSKFFSDAVIASSLPTQIEPVPFHDGMTDRRAVVRHELGHVIDHDFAGDPDIESFKSKFFARAREISGYSAKNSKEFFAECFAVHVYGSEAVRNGEIMMEFDRLIKKIIEKSKERSGVSV